MESESEHTLRRAIEAERKRSQELQEKIRVKEEETQKYKSELFTQFPGVTKDISRKLTSLQRKEYFLNSIETCDNGFKRILQDSIEKLFQEKLILESTLEQERELIIQTMSKKIAQAYTDVDSSTRSRSVSDLESNKESEEIVDSSFSSDSETNRDLPIEERKRIKQLEVELECVKQQMKMAKREVRKQKSIYDKLMHQQFIILNDKSTITQSEGEKEQDTDKSDVSFESFSSRSVGPYYDEPATKHN